MSFGGVGSNTVGGGPGITGDLGLTFDRFSLVARLSAGTILVLNALQGTVGVAVGLNERFELGVGVATGFSFGLGEGIYGSLSLLVPVRVTLTVPLKNDHQPRDRGLMFFFEAAPGGQFLQFFDGRPRAATPAFALGAWLGVGYAFW